MQFYKELTATPDGDLCLGYAVVSSHGRGWILPGGKFVEVRAHAVEYLRRLNQILKHSRLGEIG